jgi:hypothetical protein
MALKTILLNTGSEFVKLYLCDLESDKPSSGLSTGDIEVIRNCQKLFIASGSATWVEKGAAGQGTGDMLSSIYDPIIAGKESVGVAASTVSTHANLTTGVHGVGVGTVAKTSDIPSLASILLAVYPVGAVYCSVVNTSPSTLFGGTWSVFAAGRVLVGLDSGDTDFDTAEETRGAKTTQSSAQSFAGTPSSVIVNHVHVQSLPTGQSGSQNSGTRDTTTTGSGADALSTANPTGGAASYTPAGTNTPGVATSVVQPSIVVYMWKRTA